jgi:hypothetical protein
MQELSIDELTTLVRRHEAFAAQLRLKIGRKSVPENQGVGVSANSRNSRESLIFDEKAVGSAGPTSPSHRATEGEIESEDDLISFEPIPGPSENKGKGPDPRSWGEILSKMKHPGESPSSSDTTSH